MENRPSWGSALTASMRRRVHDMGLLPRLLILEVLVFALVLGGGILLIGQMDSSMRENVRRQQFLLGTAIAEDLDESLAQAVAGLQQLAAEYHLAGTTSDPEETQEILDRTAGASDTFTKGIVIVGPGGQALGADLNHQGITGIDFQRYWPSLWSPGGEGSKVLATAFTLEGDASPTVAIALPVGRGHQGEYIVGLVNTVDSYPAQIVARAVRLGSSGHADIVDARGIDLFSTEREHLLVGSDHQASYRRLFLEGEQPVVADLPQEEKGSALPGTHLMTFVHLRTLPWAISIGTSVADAFAGAHRTGRIAIGFLVALIGLAFMSTVFVGRWLVQPVKELIQTARSVAEGDRAMTVHVRWGGEIGDLARSLETMRLRLHAWARKYTLSARVKERSLALSLLAGPPVRLRRPLCLAPTQCAGTGTTSWKS